MTETPAFLAERLAAESQKTLAIFSALSPAQWQTVIYAEGEAWTARSLLSHFVFAERAFLQLFSDICKGGPGVRPDFNVDDYNAEQHELQKTVPPSKLVQQFSAVRAEMIAFVAALYPEDLQRVGRHPYLGEASLLEMVKLVYRHNQVHQRDLRRTLPG